jgi:hypothetical protein
MPARRTVTAALFTKILKNLSACGPALRFVRGKDFRTAWRTCKASAWQNWLIEKLGNELRVEDDNGFFERDSLDVYDEFTNPTFLTICYPYSDIFPNDAERQRKIKEYNRALESFEHTSYEVLGPFVEAYLLDYAAKMDAEVGGWVKGKNMPGANLNAW